MSHTPEIGCKLEKSAAGSAAATIQLSVSSVVLAELDEFLSGWAIGEFRGVITVLFQDRALSGGVTGWPVLISPNKVLVLKCVVFNI